MASQYNIQQGNTLSGIASQYGTTVNALLNANQGNPGAIPNISNPNLILAGGSLNIPDVPGSNDTMQSTMPYRTNTNSNMSDFDSYYGSAAIKERESGFNKEYKSDTDRINSELKGYRRNLSTQSQKLIDSLTQTYALRKGQQEQVTRATVAGTRASGFRTGTTQYAQNYQQDLISEKERAGIQKLAELDAEEAQKISEAEIARLDKDYAAFNDAMDKLRGIRKDKSSAVSDLYKEAVSYNKTLQDMDLDRKRYELDVKKEGRLASESDSESKSTSVRKYSISNRARRKLNRNGLDDPIIEDITNFLLDNNGDLNKLFSQFNFTNAQKRAITNQIK